MEALRSTFRFLSPRLKALSLSQSRNSSAYFTFTPDKAPDEFGETKRMNLFESIGNAMDIAMERDPSASNLSTKYLFQFFNM